MKQAKVLVIDDNTAVLSTLRIVLKSCFSTVVAVADPKLIPALISQGDVDAVLPPAGVNGRSDVIELYVLFGHIFLVEDHR